ncbi:MAG: hypothetical protein DWB56_10520 [Candidatus Jettenia sp.]|nr:MAG: hypothetical protein EDM77_10000 [Candidatus Jettenia sp. AMX1]MBC6929379.1 hypothetical protein [Candidatus Jettenia sp.]MCE7881888.1 hypothetical protein [Candidatus Jettenia sp. AMX1]MCQ3927038.1 hypothetical protein [Candidatus Jettenia sp.]
MQNRELDIASPAGNLFQIIRLPVKWETNFVAFNFTGSQERSLCNSLRAVSPQGIKNTSR